MKTHRITCAKDRWHEKQSPRRGDSMARSKNRMTQARLNVHSRRMRELMGGDRQRYTILWQPRNYGKKLSLAMASERAYLDLRDGTLAAAVIEEYDRLKERGL